MYVIQKGPLAGIQTYWPPGSDRLLDQAVHPDHWLFSLGLSQIARLKQS